MFQIVNEFERTIAEFYGSPFAVATDCCTHAIELCLRYKSISEIKVPTRTYISIPFLANKLHLNLKWDEKEWQDFYYIGNTNIIDAAVLWKEKSYIPGTYMCLSFQYQKHLSLGRGGMILTDDRDSYHSLKKLSYDGRVSNKPWRQQDIDSYGYHYYMTPETAELGIEKFKCAKKQTPRVWKWKDWPNLRELSVFR